MKLISKSPVLTLLSILLLCPTAVQGQVVSMTLEEVMGRADVHSNSMQMHAFKVKQADDAVSVAKSDKLPQIDAAISVSYLGNGYIWDRDFSNGMKADIPHYGNNFVLSAQQVVYSGGAISSGIRLAELSKQVSEQEMLKSRNDVHFMVAGYYLEMFKMDNQLRVYDQNIALTEQLIANTRARYEQGTVLENDITRYELQLSNYRLARLKVENNRKILNYQLNKVIGLDEGVQIAIDSTFLTARLDVQTEADWQQVAEHTAPMMSLSKLGLKLSEQKERLVRSDFLPKIALIAEDHLDGPVTIEVPPLDNNFNYWFVGVGIRYNLASLYKGKYKMRQARNEVSTSQKNIDLMRDNLQNAVQADYTHYLESINEVDVLHKSVQLATENYATIKTRYDNDLALATDMLDVSNARLNAELQLVNARVNVIFNYYKMKHTSGTL